MRHKKLLLLVFFLTLFVFQQVQAGATIPSKENPSQVSFAPPYAPSSTINVLVLHLDPDTNEILNHNPIKCVNGDTSHGCGIIDPEQPTAPRNPVPITVDPYYLRDVITIEMNVGQIPPTEQELPALKAQAIAARTVASWKFANQSYWYDGMVVIDNSTNYQVFIPGSYDSFPAAHDLIDRAITGTQGQFLSYAPEGTNPVTGKRMVIDAEFSSDIIPESAYGNQGYLQIVQEPISSSTCNVQGTVGNNWGMSQRGAIRWAIGNTCPDESGTDWPVQWTDYRQILVHYYTGIDILNGSGVKVAPDDRWNLLKYELPNGTTAAVGALFMVNVKLQNTSAANFNWSDVVIGYKWNDGSWTVLPNSVSSAPLGNPPVDLQLSISVPADLPTGATLHLDLGHQSQSGVSWFSQQTPNNWPDAQIKDITVTGGSTPTPSATATPAYPPGARGYTAPLTVKYYNDPRQTSWYVGQPITWASFTNPVATGYVNFIDFTWNVSSPASGVNGTYWSAIYDGILHVSVEGDYVFYLDRLDDGGQLYIDGVSRINSWRIQGAGSHPSPPVRLIPGRQHAIQVKYAQGPGSGGSIRVAWALPNGFPKEVITQVSAMSPTPTSISLTPTVMPPGFTPPAPTATFTPQPTFTPSPTFTPTPIPCWCPLKFLAGLFCNETSSNSANMVLFRAASAIQSAAFDIQVFYRVRDELLSQSPEGQRYIDLYNAHGIEISEILRSNPVLADEAIATLQLWQPNLQALVDGNGNTVTITAEQIQSIQTFLDRLSVLGSPALQQTIADERARRPLESMTDMTMDQAWNYLNGYQIACLPPLNTKNPYSAQQGRVVPVEFTLTDMDGNFVEDQSVTLRVLDANGNVVMSSVGISNNPMQGIVIQGQKYHYNLDTSGLQKGNYALQVLYNSTNPQEPSVWQIAIAGKK